MFASPQTRVTPEEYLEKERAAEFRSEYYGGYVYAMAGASMRHGIIIGNFAHAFATQLEKRPCVVVTTDLRVRSAPEGLYTYPDVLVVCGEPKLADQRKDIL